MFIAFPLLAIPVLLYNIFALFMAGGVNSLAADERLRHALFSIPMASGGSWQVGFGDVLLLLALVLLFFELLKSTSSDRVAIVNHSLSMILFIVCLVEFLLLKSFATSTFFLLSMMVLLDVVAGFIVTIIAARRDLEYTGG